MIFTSPTKTLRLSQAAHKQKQQEMVSTSNTNFTCRYPSFLPILSGSSITARSWALSMNWAHDAKSLTLLRKSCSGTSKSKTGPGGLVRVAMFRKSHCAAHCATCTPAFVTLYHVTASCKGSIVLLCP